MIGPSDPDQRSEDQMDDAVARNYPYHCTVQHLFSASARPTRTEERIIRSFNYWSLRPICLTRFTVVGIRYAAKVVVNLPTSTSVRPVRQRLLAIRGKRGPWLSICDPIASLETLRILESRGGLPTLGGIYVRYYTRADAQLGNRLRAEDVTDQAHAIAENIRRMRRGKIGRAHV